MQDSLTMTFIHTLNDGFSKIYRIPFILLGIVLSKSIKVYQYNYRNRTKENAIIYMWIRE